MAQSRRGGGIRTFNRERRAGTGPPPSSRRLVATIRGELSALRSALVILLLIAPGLAGSLALVEPEDADPVTHLALVFALGYAVDAAAAFVLMLGRVLVPWAWFALVGAATAALAALALRRHAGAHVRSLTEVARRDASPLAAGLVVLCGAAIVRLGFSATANFNAPVAFRYWADGIEIADAHRLPEFSLQLGRLFPPASSKVVLNAFNGAASFVLGRDPLHALGPLLWFGAVGLMVALWAAGRELGLRLLAPLVPVLLVANRLVLDPEMTRDMDTYRAEVFGRMVAFAGLALAVAAVRGGAGRRRAAILAGLLLGVAAGTHLVPLAVAFGVLAWFAVAGLAVGGGWATVRGAGLVVGVAVIVALAVLILPRGDVGFQGVTARNAYARFGPRFDPTTFVLTGKRPSPTARPRASPSYARPADIVTRFFSEGLRRLPLALCAVLAAVALAIALAMLRWFPPPLRPLGLTAWGTGLAFVAVAVVFGRGFHVMILAEFGRRRLSDYASLPWILLGLGLIEGGVLLVTRERATRWVALACAVVVVLASTPLVWSARAPSRAGARGGRAIPVLAMVRRATECDARILANRRTIATFESMTGRAGLVEGMAPYLRPDMLVRAVNVIEAAERFFHDPAAGRSILAEEGIDDVLAVGRTVPFGPLAGPIDGTPATLDGVRFLRLVATAGSSRLYRVVGIPLADRPGPVGRPGYRCERAGAP
jgi:hypothetical protein